MKIENNFYKIFAQLKHAKRPFVLYRLPNNDTLTYIQQKDSSNYTTVSLKEEGFVFAPFIPFPPRFWVFHVETGNLLIYPL